MAVANGRYVSAEGGGREVVANPDEIGPREMFDQRR